jgi:putative holliday junction resolvase
MLTGKKIMRILGIDYGDARIGIAVSDPLCIIANGLETIKWKGDIPGAVGLVMKYIKQYDTNKAVVGFPRNMNGTIGPRGEKTQEFIDALKRKSGIEIVKWDERLTSKAADRVMHEMGIKTSKKKASIDRIAAVIILQGFLDSEINKQMK